MVSERITAASGATHPSAFIVRHSHIHRRPGKTNCPCRVFYYYYFREMNKNKTLPLLSGGVCVCPVRTADRADLGEQ